MNEQPTPYNDYLERLERRLIRSGKRWGPEEEHRLRSLRQVHKSVDEIADELQRSTSSIRGRLHKLGLFMGDW